MPRRPSVSQDAQARLAALLAASSTPISATDVGIVVAHPDDETIGCGAMLSRWQGASLIMVTDGAPTNLEDARALGFATAADYADARRRELNEAVAIAGVAPENQIRLDIPDQQVVRRLAEVTHLLIALVESRGLRVLFTHAYEGGHPDHDATAFAVHAAAQLLRNSGRDILIVEMPYYREGENGEMLRQSFISQCHSAEVPIKLSADQVALKRSMMAAHASQQHILIPFSVDIERFRPAPDYDFTVSANRGQLLYEKFNWGLSGSEWPSLVRAAATGLGLTTMRI